MLRYWTDRANSETMLLVRHHWQELHTGLRARVASEMGCHVEEIELVRNATEALLALISGYNRFSPDDKVLCIAISITPAARTRWNGCANGEASRR